jgi:hypothetical protein
MRLTEEEGRAAVGSSAVTCLGTLVDYSKPPIDSFNKKSKLHVRPQSSFLCYNLSSKSLLSLGF